MSREDRALCPACDTPTPRGLHELNAIAAVDYYRCVSCGHVWTTTKNSATLLKHVTPLPEKAPPKK